MPNRTVRFRGFAVGTTPTTVTATYNGSQIFSGEITTLTSPIPLPADPSDVGTVPTMFTMELPMDASGNVPMTIISQGNPVTVCQISANYCNIANVVGNTVTFTSSGPDRYFDIFLPPVAVDTNDCRINVTIGGVPQTITSEQRGNLLGTWWWSASSNVEIAYDLLITAGLE
jgi:hypothetical protein